MATTRVKAGEKKRSEAGNWSVEELAAEAGTSVRNLRAFQDRGVLPPPERKGRRAVYGELHLFRLRVVLRLQERGYNLGSIHELIMAAESGRDVGELIGLDQAITAPLAASRVADTPATMTQAQLMRLFGFKRLPRDLVRRAVAMEFLAPDGQRFRAPNIGIIDSAAELVRAGISLADLLDIAERLRGNMQRTADDVLVHLAGVIDSYGTGIPPAEDLPRIAELIHKLRRLVDSVVLAEAHRAIEQSVARIYGDRLARTINNVAS